MASKNAKRKQGVSLSLRDIEERTVTHYCSGARGRCVYYPGLDPADPDNIGYLPVNQTRRASGLIRSMLR
jgi:hypothetical protein